jgi:ribonuclease D
VFISTYDELRDACARWASEPVLALDTEFIRERTYYPTLCLLQVGTETEQHAIDTLAVKDLSPLAPLFKDPSIVKVFHACTQDLEILNTAVGCLPAPLFDTQVAAAFLGQKLQIGYGPLVEAYCNVHIAKADSLSDWSRRPLDSDQLKYALDDVKYLPGIYHAMVDELVASDRLQWVLPEMEALLDPALYVRDPRDAYQHVKRNTSLTRKQLAVLREVAAWRERYAARHNIPRKWVVSDEVMLELSKRPPQTPEKLLRTRGTESLSRNEVDGLLGALKKGKLCPPAEYPVIKHRAKPSLETESVIDLMYAMVRLVSERSGVAPALIATRDDLYDFITDRPASKLSRGWRKTLMGDQLDLLLGGRAGLTVKDGRIEIL